MKIPYKSLITIDKKSSQPIYLQLSKSMIEHIQSGILISHKKLPSSREMAELLGINRNTVVAAYQELMIQGWIEIFPKKGTFVSQNIPIIKPKNFKNQKENKDTIQNFSNFEFNNKISLPQIITQKLAFNDGLPDARLAPKDEMAKLYAKHIRFGDSLTLGYTDVKGNERFREIFARQLNETRGLNINTDNLLTTRGSQMSIYLSAASFLSKNDNVIVGDLNYKAANMTFEYCGANLLTVSVDEDGILVNQIEEHCKNHKVKMLYITSHHYHPTTVTLKPERRIQLLDLAQKYQFYILEDDYDYDFHYANSPILPLASADKNGLVIYMGSFTKKIAPAFRLGYIIAHEALINEMAKLRRIIDRQNDTILECVMADMIENGILKRYENKALKIYKERRDLICHLLKSELNEYIDFEIPQGGLAIWAKFHPSIDLVVLSENVGKRGLYLGNGLNYPKQINACRLGFAGLNEREMQDAVKILKAEIEKLAIPKNG